MALRPARARSCGEQWCSQRNAGPWGPAAPHTGQETHVMKKAKKPAKKAKKPAKKAAKKR